MLMLIPFLHTVHTVYTYSFPTLSKMYELLRSRGESLALEQGRKPQKEGPRDWDSVSDGCLNNNKKDFKYRTEFLHRYVEGYLNLVSLRQTN